MVKLTDTQVGYLAEAYVAYELAKRGIVCTNLCQDFDFDLITDTGDRIEVKSARPQTGYSGRDYKNGTRKNPHIFYSFHNLARKNVNEKGKGYFRETYSRDRQCDFFIFVCFNKNLTVHKTYVFPKEFIGTKKLVAVPVERKRPLRKGAPDNEQYLGKWDLLTHEKVYGINKLGAPKESIK